MIQYAVTVLTGYWKSRLDYRTNARARYTTKVNDASTGANVCSPMSPKDHSNVIIYLRLARRNLTSGHERSPSIVC